MASYNARAQSAPDVAADAHGGFVVVWGATKQDGFGLFGQRFSVPPSLQDR